MTDTNVVFKGISHKPEWFKIKPSTNQFSDVKRIIKKYRLTTICAEGHCPNNSECWSGGTATFMVLGDTCTRGCRFCNVKTAAKGEDIDKEEPQKLVKALKEIGIFDYVVLTSVDRDDLEDQGSIHFANCIRAIKLGNPNMIVEVLIPDFNGDIKLLKNITDAKPDVISHNIETVERLQRRTRDIRANYAQSLSVLENVKKLDKNIITKSGIMVGLGETREEVEQAMKDLLKIGVNIFTIGQYLRPSQRHLPFVEYIHPDVFEDYRKKGEKFGFAFVASGPFVRSSYKAGELFIKNILKPSNSLIKNK